MYDNIGRKIKLAAKVLFGILVLASIICGLTMINKNEFNDELKALGILIIFGGSALSLFLSWLTFGYGEIIEKISNIEKSACGIKENQSETTVNSISQKKRPFSFKIKVKKTSKSVKITFIMSLIVGVILTIISPWIWAEGNLNYFITCFSRDFYLVPLTIPVTIAIGFVIYYIVKLLIFLFKLFKKLFISITKKGAS